MRRLLGQSSTPTLNVNPQNFKDAAIIAADLILDGVRTIKEFGERFRHVFDEASDEDIKKVWKAAFPHVSKVLDEEEREDESKRES